MFKQYHHYHHNLWALILHRVSVLKTWVGIQVRPKWCTIDYYLIFRHVQTTEIGQNLLTNLQQPRRIYARNCTYDGLECQPSLAIG